MIVAGPEGFQKNQYRKFNIRAVDLTPGDDFGMMREVLSRRFKRLMNDAPRDVPVAPSALAVAGQMPPAQDLAPADADEAGTPRKNHPGPISSSSMADGDSSRPRRRRSVRSASPTYLCSR